MKQKFLVFALFLMIGAFGILNSNMVLAACGISNSNSCDTLTTSGDTACNECSSYCYWYTPAAPATPSCAPLAENGSGIPVPDIEYVVKTDLKTVIVEIINMLLGLLGFIAVIITLYGGFTWMTAAGDSKKVDEAKTIIKNGVIGLIVIFLSWAIVSFVLGIVSDL